jgi:hypothetical protein
MADYWARWLDAAGFPVPRDAEGHSAIPIEISPRFARTREEFIAKSQGRDWTLGNSFALDAAGKQERDSKEK